MFPLGMVQVGSGGAANVTFSSIPSTYTHLQIRWISRDSAADTGVQNVVASFNSDTTYTNYRTHYITGDGSSASAGDLQLSGLYASAGLNVSNNATANIFGVGIIDILDYKNTNKYKTVRTLTGIDLNGSGGQVRLASSLWMNTAAISNIVLNVRSSGNFTQYSQFALYGIKGA
jgi:hypothetical protein